MTHEFLDVDVLESFPMDEFLAQRPFPWWSIEAALRPEKFAELHAAYPSLDLFDWHESRDRAYGQRPHNRYYTAYRNPLYSPYEGHVKEDFPEVWQRFLTELETSDDYQRFLVRVAGHPDLNLRYTFHVAKTGSEVSPHLDKPRKVSTHIFYFNTVDDWDPAWGGATIVLDGKRSDNPAPDYSDFTDARRVDNLGNRSFIFRNTEDAWHGVPPMVCPEGHYRRLFNVVAERPDEEMRARSAGSRKGLRSRIRALVSH